MNVKAVQQSLHRRLLETTTYHASSGEFTTRYNTTRRASSQRIGTLRQSGAYIVSFEGKLYTASRLAYFWKTGEWPTGTMVMKTKTRSISDYRWNNLVHIPRAV